MRITFYRLALGVIGVLCLFAFPACDSSAIPVEQNGCTWIDDSISAEFDHGQFALLEKDCDRSFDDMDMDWSVPIDGVYNLMHTLETNSSVDTCTLTWISSIYTKKCDNTDLESNNGRVKLDLTNYSSRLYPLNILERSPIVQNDCQTLPEDYKHQLIIQIPHVYNTTDLTHGTLTWIYTWLGETDSNFSENDHMWYFDCGNQEFNATYTPDFGNPRYIYVFNTFQYVY